MVDAFIPDSVKRSEAEMTGMHEQPPQPAVFTRILSMKCPEDFPERFVAAATQTDIRIASLEAKGSLQLLHPRSCSVLDHA